MAFKEWNFLCSWSRKRKRSYCIVLDVQRNFDHYSVFRFFLMVARYFFCLSTDFIYIFFMLWISDWIVWQSWYDCMVSKQDDWNISMIFGYAYPACGCFKVAGKRRIDDLEQLLFRCRYWYAFSHFIGKTLMFLRN